MDLFDILVEQLLTEINVQDRNDPAFEDYVGTFVLQLKRRDLIPPDTDSDELIQRILDRGWYIHKDTNNNVSYKVTFLFDKSIKSDMPNNLRVEIENLLEDEPSKMIENTHQEESIDEIVDFLDKATKGAQEEAGKVPGEDIPMDLGSDASSAMPAAKPPGFEKPTNPVEAPQQAPSTSQYLKGL
jgi:hypothetical protein